MKNPIRKSMLRSLLKTVLKFISIGIVLYFFISNVFKFININLETERIGEHFKSVGTVYPINSVGNNIVNPEVIKLIRESDYIERENYMKFTQGIINNVQNLDYSFKDKYPIESKGTEFSPLDDINLYDVIYVGKLESIDKINKTNENVGGISIRTTIEKDFIINPEYGDEAHKDILNRNLIVMPNSPIVKRPLSYITPQVIDELENLKENSYYLFRGYLDNIASLKFVLKPLYKGGPLYYPVDNITSFNLDGEMWDELRENVEIINTNLHTFTIIGTKDLSSLPGMQENVRSYFLEEGRWLNAQDDESLNNVCVISSKLAVQNNIKIGDEISINHRNMATKNSYIFSAENRKNWKSVMVSEPVKYKVVGLYGQSNRLVIDSTNIVDEINNNYIFVPENTIPEEYRNLDKNINYRYYSFVLKTSKDEEKFLEEYAYKFKELGFELKFIENISKEYWKDSQAVKMESLNNSIILGVLVLVIMILITFLHFEDYKKIYAIERILGLPKKLCMKHLLYPLIIGISLITAIVITIIGSKTSINNKNLLETHKVLGGMKGNIPFVYYIIVFLGVVIVFTLISYLQVKRLESLTLIKIIQGKSKNEKNEVLIAKPDDMNESRISQSISIPNHEKVYGSTKVSNSKKLLNTFIIKKLMRLKIQTILLTIIPLGLVVSTLMINSILTRNSGRLNRAYKTTEVNAEFYTSSKLVYYNGFQGDISENMIDLVLESGLVDTVKKDGYALYNHMYLEKNGALTLYKDNNESMQLTEDKFAVYFTNHLGNENGTINLDGLELKKGYDINIFNEKWEKIDQKQDKHILQSESGDIEIPILVSNELAQDLKLKIGDKLQFFNEKRMMYKVHGTIVGTFKKMKNNTKINLQFTEMRDRSFFIMPINAINYFEKNKLFYDSAEFIFNKDKNHEIKYVREDLINKIANHKDNYTDFELKIGMRN